MHIWILQCLTSLMLHIIQNPRGGSSFSQKSPVTCDFLSTLTCPCNSMPRTPGLTRAPKNEEYAVLSNKCGKFVKKFSNDSYRDKLKIFEKRKTVLQFFEKRPTSTGCLVGLSFELSAALRDSTTRSGYFSRPSSSREVCPAKN